MGVNDLGGRGRATVPGQLATHLHALQSMTEDEIAGIGGGARVLRLATARDQQLLARYTAAAAAVADPTSALSPEIRRPRSLIEQVLLEQVRAAEAFWAVVLEFGGESAL